MKKSNFSIIIGLMALFIVNGFANSLNRKAIITFFPHNSAVTKIHFNVTVVNTLFDFEAIELQDDNEDENEDDNDESEKEVKALTDIHSSIFFIKVNGYSNPIKIFKPKQTYLTLFYKSWQSFLQIFRL